VPFDWARLNDIFHRVIEAPVDQRAALLDEACADDPELRREIESLIAAHDRAGDFIEKPGVSAADLLAEALEHGATLVGRTLGQYRVRRVLGEGGMGIVYLADDTRLGRPVALKALAPRFTTDPARRERLMREARAAAALTHPGIATVYALEEFDDHIYIASEYIPGATLRAELEHGPLPVARVIDAGLQLARALATAHERGIVHRDLKPENLIRSSSGDLKILDFGLARFRDAAQGAAALTGEGALLGTPAYMSPEQIRGESVDFRSDLFAIGSILYELATGTHPFAGGDSASTIARILESEPRRLAEFMPTLGPAGTSMEHLESIVMTCLQKPAGARYRSTEALIAALERGRSALSDARITPATRPSSASSADTVRGRSPRWWWEFHQTAASIGYVALLAPMWVVHTAVPELTGLLVFVAGLAAVVTAGILRMHLVFAARSYPAEHAGQQRSVRPWIHAADAVFALTLIADGALILTVHASVAMVLIGASVAVAVSSGVIEPATTRAAFGDR
jgi:serine/threonine protein kinase